MPTSDDTGWATYYAATRGHPPRPLLVRAVETFSVAGEALDLGCGAGNETRYLLDHGFRVTAVDADPAAIRGLEDIEDRRLSTVQSSFDAFAFGADRYDLISAQLALPFNPPETFDDMFTRVRSALKPAGILCCDLWGVNDDWNVPDSGLTFHTREEVLRLVRGLDLLDFREIEEEVELAIRGTRHAHWYEITARRIT
jgi:SAM-dependent methyltransferase